MPTLVPLTVTDVSVPPLVTTVAGSGDVFVTGVPLAGTAGVLNPLPQSRVAPLVAPVSGRTPGVSGMHHSTPKAFPWPSVLFVSAPSFPLVGS